MKKYFIWPLAVCFIYIIICQFASMTSQMFSLCFQFCFCCLALSSVFFSLAARKVTQMRLLFSISPSLYRYNKEITEEWTERGDCSLCITFPVNWNEWNIFFWVFSWFYLSFLIFQSFLNVCSWTRWFYELSIWFFCLCEARCNVEVLCQ